MHSLMHVAKQVDKTHPHLGKAVVMAMLGAKACRLVLFIAPRGCGKSRAASFVASQQKGSLFLDRLSVAGLPKLQQEFTGFRDIVCVDDIAKSQTPYARIVTITTLAELCYSHYIRSHMSDSQYEITEFHGAGLVNMQPILVRELINSPEWEASIQDKSIRYYHLYRPLTPNPDAPDVRIDWGIPIEDVEEMMPKGKLGKSLITIGRAQWGYARTLEHLSALLRAAAGFDHRKKVTQSDYKLLLDVLRPLQIERLVTSKQAFESERSMLTDYLALLTEFLTYGEIPLSQLALDYSVTEGQCRRIMNRYTKDWIVVAKSPTVYAPSEELRAQMREVGL